MKSKRKVIDVIIIILSGLVALYCLYSWISHGMPIWSNEHIPGTTNQISIWLTGVVLATIIGVIAYFDFSIYKK